MSTGSAVFDTNLINTIEFIDEREKLLFAKSQLREQVLEFLGSPIGRYLHGCAKQELEECQREALECNADNFFGRRKLRRIQARGAAARNFTGWLADAIIEGGYARKELSTYREG